MTALATLSEERPCGSCGGTDGWLYVTSSGYACEACVRTALERKAELERRAAGWRLCDHGYLPACYICGRGIDAEGRAVG